MRPPPGEHGEERAQAGFAGVEAFRVLPELHEDLLADVTRHVATDEPGGDAVDQGAVLVEDRGERRIVAGDDAGDDATFPVAHPSGHRGRR